MEKMMNTMQATGKKAMDCLAKLVKTTTETASQMWTEVTGKLSKSLRKKSKTLCKKSKALCKKATESVSEHREGVLLGAAICSGVIAAASCVGYALCKKK